MIVTDFIRSIFLGMVIRVAKKSRIGHHDGGVIKLPK
jgi:hypothetical protein